MMCSIALKEWMRLELANPLLGSSRSMDRSSSLRLETECQCVDVNVSEMGTSETQTLTIVFSLEVTNHHFTNSLKF
jgi:hypothetical protein